jgi:hypothetical protein
LPKTPPYWSWEVVGILETPEGKLVISLGDWIIKDNNCKYHLYKLNDFTQRLNQRKVELC